MRLYRLLFAGMSLLPLISIYLINRSVTISNMLNAFSVPNIATDWPDIISYTIYILIPLILAFVSHKLFPKLDHSNIKAKHIKMVESASAIFLPTFFGYIFIGLSIGNLTSLFFVYIVLTTLCYCAEIYLYNPIFHFLGYHFYFITADKNKLLVITKKTIRLGEYVEFQKLGQLNDYTYIDILNSSKDTEA